MDREKTSTNQETRWENRLIPPATELLLNIDRLEEAWPKDLAHNESFRAQITERRTIRNHLNSVISRLPQPDMPLERAIREGLVTEQQAADMYESLSILLENGDYKRVLLYIPFEFLPGVDWKTNSPSLKENAERFRSAYMAAWRAQLHTHDVRANFVDGDVLESSYEARDFPRVVKAAHLIPELIQHNLLTIHDVIGIIKESDDEVLRQSIADTLPVLADLGFMNDAELAQMRTSEDPLLKQTTTLIDSFKNKPSKPEEINEPISLFEVTSCELEQIDTEEYYDITQKRAEWLRQEKRRKTIEAAAHKLESAISNNSFPNVLLGELMAPTTPPETQEVLVLAIRNAIESMTGSNIEKARELYAHYSDIFLSIWQYDNLELHEMLTATFYRLFRLHIVDGKQLESLKLSMPTFNGPLSKNLTSSPEEVESIREITEQIESDPELSLYVYPVTLISGSRLKGYATTNADIDVAVFVKPTISFAEKEKVRRALKDRVSHKKIHGEILEFWLEETPLGLGVRDFEETDASLGESYFTQNLFGAVWDGDQETIDELRKKLLVPYFYETKKIIHGRNARGLYLEELERDTLQYRLMHKGYARFFPAFGGLHTPHSSDIDGDSVFWDSGYRQLALKLFINRVFLPKISAKKEG